MKIRYDTLILGINVKGVLTSAAMVKKKFDKGSRIAQVHLAADHLKEALELQRELKSGIYFQFIIFQ